MRGVHLATLLLSGNGSQMNSVEDEPAAAIAAALDQVGPRLKRLRTHRQLTLTGVAETTGISKSTLSRLETGGAAHPGTAPGALTRLPGTARRSGRRTRRGRPAPSTQTGPRQGPDRDPLTRQSDGLQAWRIIISTDKATPNRARMRATSGSTSFLATCGSSSVTKTWSSGPVRSPPSTPRCRTGSAAGTEPAEILSIFGRPGERMTVRGTPAQT